MEDLFDGVIEFLLDALGDLLLDFSWGPTRGEPFNGPGSNRYHIYDLSNNTPQR